MSTATMEATTSEQRERMSASAVSIVEQVCAQMRRLFDATAQSVILSIEQSSGLFDPEHGDSRAQEPDAKRQLGRKPRTESKDLEPPVILRSAEGATKDLAAQRRTGSRPKNLATYLTFSSA